MRAAFLVVVAVTTIASSSCRTVQPIAAPSLGATSLSSETAPRVAENTPPQGAEISDDPIVRFVAKAVNGQDGDAALQIASLTNDKAVTLCILWARLPQTQQKASELIGVKGILQILPVHPQGLISAYAEGRRVKRDVLSGAASARIAQWRGKLMELTDEFELNCSAAGINRGVLGGLIAGGL